MGLPVMPIHNHPCDPRTAQDDSSPGSLSVLATRISRGASLLTRAKRSAPVVCLCFAACWSAGAQTDPDAHVWLQYFGDHPLGSTRWGLHLEGQLRRHDVFRAPQNLLLRPALNFRVHPKVELTAGYGYISHHRYGKFPQARSWSEHRLFQDVKAQHAAGRARLLHRFRFENRWLVNGLYENRFRYMARATIPLRGPWYLALWDEIFLPVKPEQFPQFSDQNRATLALGKRLTDHVRVEAGYMLQTVWQRNGRIREDNHTIVFAVFSSSPFRRRK